MKKIVLALSILISASSVGADYKKTLSELETLANQGNLIAQIKLGTAYRKGTGVTQDYKKAVKWFTLAAEQGNAFAQYNLGVMHSFGLGVVPNYEPAVKWYTLAAEQGNALAQYNLGRLYFLGQGVSENLVYAHMWSKQASLNGFGMGDDFSKLLIDFMSAAQIEEAHQLENDCLKKNIRDVKSSNVQRGFYL